ncbi:MAG: metallophosphoesterase [Burkholderiaceae bacterium]
MPTTDLELVAPPPSPETAGEAATSVPAESPVVAVHDLDWPAIGRAADPASVRARMRQIVERMETLLDQAGGPGLLFDSDRTHAADRAIRVSGVDAASALWIIGDLHGDLLALEASLAQIRAHAGNCRQAPSIIFLGDFFDDEGFGLEVLLRLFELIVEAPGRVCVIAGNHDEALSYDGVRFASTVSPSDFADFLNANLAHEWIERVGKLAVRLTATAPRALFFPDGLLVAHAGFPLVDLHAQLAASGNWNDPACLSDFVWGRAHPKARRKMPNRFSRGSQFGHDDFADFCALSATLGRPVTHMARGHDHVEERWAVYPAYRRHPILTTVALSRRLPREAFGPHERAPTLARVIPESLPQVYQLHVPGELIHALFPPARSEAMTDETGELVQS